MNFQNNNTYGSSSFALLLGSLQNNSTIELTFHRGEWHTAEGGMYWAMGNFGISPCSYLKMDMNVEKAIENISVGIK